MLGGDVGRSEGGGEAVFVEFPNTFKLFAILEFLRFRGFVRPQVTCCGRAVLGDPRRPSCKAKKRFSEATKLVHVMPPNSGRKQDVSHVSGGKYECIALLRPCALT